MGRVALNASRYPAVEALNGDTGWSTFRGRCKRATHRLGRMDNARVARKVNLWSVHESKWIKNCMRKVGDDGMRIIVGEQRGTG